MKKRLFCIMMALLLIFSFAACSGGGEETSTDAGGDTSTDPAANWPEKPLTFIYPYEAGGGGDLFLRLIGQYLNTKNGWDVVVQNIPGNSGAVGTTELYNADPDGYTFLQFNIEPIIINQLTEKTTFDPLELEYFSVMSYDPQIITVPNNSPIQTLDDLIAACKAENGEFSFASIGINGYNTMLYNMFMSMAGLTGVYVPYNGGPEANAAVLGGHQDAEFLLVNGLAPLIQSGEMRGLAVTTDERMDIIPDVPTFKESGFDIVMQCTRAFEAPPGTPIEIIEKLEAALDEVFKDPEFQEAALDVGTTTLWMSKSEVDQYIEDMYPVMQQMYDDMIAMAEAAAQ